MNKVVVITILESVYLIYMYFGFKTNYSFSGATFEKQIQSIGNMFIHDTGMFESKICNFGKIVAVLAVILAICRAYSLIYYQKFKNTVIGCTIGFDILCIYLAYNMNLNALLYIIPLLLTEIYLLL